MQAIWIGPRDFHVLGSAAYQLLSSIRREVVNGKFAPQTILHSSEACGANKEHFRYVAVLKREALTRRVNTIGYDIPAGFSHNMLNDFLSVWLAPHLLALGYNWDGLGGFSRDEPSGQSD